MKQENKRIDEEHITGPKTKGCLLLTWAYLLFLTWLVISRPNENLVLQSFCLLSTIVVIYLQILLIQDYYFIKSKSRCQKCVKYRKDIRIVQPLIPERLRKKR